MNKSVRTVSSIILILNLYLGAKCAEHFSYPNWQLQFPKGSGMGLFMAFAIPLSEPYDHVYFATNYEANYRLPTNETNEWDYPPLLQKRIDRKLIYDAIEHKLISHGYIGKECLLRTICEAAFRQISSGNGILGDLIHLLLTPSASRDQISEDYQNAEKYGSHQKNCQIYNNNCTVSFLDMISEVNE